MSPRLSSAALALLACSIATPAAAEHKLFGKPVVERAPLTAEQIEARRAAFEQHLRDADLVQLGDHLDSGARLRGELEPRRAWEDPPHYTTIFLNFFGGELSSGTNAAEMQAGCVGAIPVMYPGYAGNESTALTMIQVFQNAMEPYAVRIAYEDAPPAHLPYSMVMMGGDPTDIGMGSGILGVSCSSDCGDTWWRDTTFAFTEASGSALTIGNTALQEAAHAFGLDHIDGSEHIMYPFGTSGEKIWATECTPYNDATGGISCTYVHDEFCGEDSGMQNDDAELLAFFGPNAPDVEPPVVTITEPAEDVIELPSGTLVDIAAEVSDDNVGAGWRLRVVPQEGDELVENAYDFRTSWSFGVPDGVYEVYVEAVDHDLNEGSDMVTVYVGTAPPVDTGGGTADESGSSGAPDESSGEGGDEGESTGVAEDDDGAPKSCACDVKAPPGAGLLLLALVPLSRRRRRSR